MKLFPDFREFIKLLNKNGVEYLVIGGYAVVFHGYVRTTVDLDIWIKNSSKNSEKIFQALKDFGFGSVGLTPADFIKKNAIIQLGFPPRRIDIVTTPSGVSFDTCYHKRVVTTIQNVKVNFIDFKSLVKNKKSSGRLKDIADIDNLK